MFERLTKVRPGLLRAIFFITASCLLFVMPVKGGVEVITLHGEWEAVARGLGQQTSALLRKRLNMDDMTSQLIPFMATPQGEALYQQLYSTSVAAFPDLVQEMRWIAAGANISFRQLFLINAVDEVEAFVEQLGQLSGSLASTPPQPQPPTATTPRSHASRKRIGHCTDVMTKNDPSSSGRWGHNEDGDVTIDGPTTYMTNITIINATTGRIQERFIAFAYPGTLSGDAFGWNARGMVFSQNYIWAANLSYFGPLTQLVCRAIYRKSTIEEAIAHLHRYKGGSAYNLNMGNIYTKQFVNVEVDPRGAISVHDVVWNPPASPFFWGISDPPRTFFVHANTYQVLSAKNEEDPSSAARLRVLYGFPAPNSSAQIERMLGDVSDADNPVYDPTSTLATVVYDFDRLTASVFNASPATTAPLYHLSLMLAEPDHAEVMGDHGEGSASCSGIGAAAALCGALGTIILVATALLATKKCERSAKRSVEKDPLQYSTNEVEYPRQA